VKSNMTNSLLVSDLMIESPVCAEVWQPIGFIRQQMLANSYSYLPVLDGTWKIVSASSVARFLGRDATGAARNELLAMPLQDAAKMAPDLLKVAANEEISPDAGLPDALTKLESADVLLVIDPQEVNSENGKSETRKILGILTAFDLL
jgi:CBS domain-containing protein